MTFLIIVFLIGAILYLASRLAEKTHIVSLYRREHELQHILATSSQDIPLTDQKIEKSELVMGTAVYTHNPLKKVITHLLSFTGGRLTAYEELLDRARREALIRLKEQAYSADMIVNVRVHTTSTDQPSHQTSGNVEAIAAGTAVYFTDTNS